MKKIVIGLIQIWILCIFTYTMEVISTILHLKIPGSILGLVVLFILLQTKIVKLKWIEIGGNWLVAELLLFFIPSAVGIVQYKHLLMDNGVKIITVIFISSSLVMICSGLLAERMAKRKEKKEKNEDTFILNSHH